MSLVQGGKSGPAIEILEKILGQSPRDLRALNLLGIALIGSGRRDEASRRFEQAVHVDPRFVPAHVLVLRRYVRTERDFDYFF